MEHELNAIKRRLQGLSEEQASFLINRFEASLHNRLWALWHRAHDGRRPPNYLKMQYMFSSSSLDMPRLFETHTPDQVADLIKFAPPEQQPLLRRQLCCLLRQRRALRPRLQVVEGGLSAAR